MSMSYSQRKNSGDTKIKGTTNLEQQTKVDFEGIPDADFVDSISMEMTSFTRIAEKSMKDVIFATGETKEGHHSIISTMML